MVNEGSEANGMAVALAKALGKPLSDVSEALVQAAAVAGQPLGIAIGMLSDRIYAWRWSKRIEILRRASELLEGKTVSPDAMPPGFLIPLLEKAGDVENPDLQQLWAQLIVSASTDDSAHHPAFVNVLHSMSAEDAEALRGFANSHYHEHGFFSGPLITPGEDAAYDRLVGLGVFRYEYRGVDPEIQHLHAQLQVSAEITALGIGLIQAVGIWKKA